MALRAEVSIPAALATAAVVGTIYNRGLPPGVDVRTNPTVGDRDVEAARKQNAWTAAAVVGGISLIAKDPTIFIVGGAMLVALDWVTRVNNFVNPLSGKIEDAYESTRITQAPVNVEQAPAMPNPGAASSIIGF